MERWTLLRGDCLEVLKGIADNSIDACVTDPPYGLSEHTDIPKMVRHWFVGKPFENKSAGFMGKEWDSFVPGPEIWREVYRVLKPGGHLLAFSGSRTVDLMGISIRFAGFEMRDTILAWMYGSGFPKSLNVSKAIDKAAGAEREVVGSNPNVAGREASKGRGDGLADYGGFTRNNAEITAPATDAAKQWDGWGTALKPAFEPVLVVQKPSELTVAENSMTYGVGGLNIDATRVGSNGGTRRDGKANAPNDAGFATLNAGRWPPNVLLTHHPECVEDGECHPECGSPLLDTQQEGVARFYPQFYYRAKPSRSERNAGLEDFPESLPRGPNGAINAVSDGRGSRSKPRANSHPTVKPVDVMRWLIKLVVPEGGLVLDPFNGSGTTGVAALHEGVRYVGIEREPQYADIAEARLRHAAANTEGKSPFVPVPLKAPSDTLPTTVAPPSSEALRNAFDITEEVALERKPGGLSPKDFKRLVSKGLKR